MDPMNPMMGKWSARPSNDKASRVRNNQRRHRQRVKEHIAHLESRLEDTERQLRDALDRVTELTRDLERTAQRAAPPQTQTVEPPILSAPPESSVIPRAQLLDYSEDECCSLPPPGPGKSTTRCRDAYIIIAQQNYRALDSYVIRQWLEPGFYGALGEGDGCRVDTEVLFGLLDFISSD